MGYEKLYKEALERARQVHTTNVDEKKTTEYIFPELKESEEEKNIKNLIDELKCSLRAANCQNDACGGGHEKRIALLEWGIAWLEKQGEKSQRKSALEAIKEEKADNDIKIKPKFKVGQWIVWQDKCYKVNDNGCGYELVDQNGLSTSLEYGTIDENAHIWDIIKDAKDGDVLVSRSPFIYGKLCPYGGLSGVIFIKASNFIFSDSPVHPATKEEREFLFSKMKEAGYKWDANNKQLIKL